MFAISTRSTRISLHASPPTQLLANQVGPPAAQGQAVFQQVLLQLPVPQPDFPALTLQIHDAGDGKVIRSVMGVKMARGLPLTMRVTQGGPPVIGPPWPFLRAWGDVVEGLTDWHKKSGTF